MSYEDLLKQLSLFNENANNLLSKYDNAIKKIETKVIDSEAELDNYTEDKKKEIAQIASLIKIVDNIVKNSEGEPLNIDNSFKLNNRPGSDYVLKEELYNPYGAVHIMWDGSLEKPNVNNRTVADGAIKFGVTNASEDTDYLTTPWYGHYMLGIGTGNTTTSCDNITSYGWIELPIDTTVDNTIFLKMITGDRWSSYKVYVVDNEGIVRDLLQHNTNSVRNNSGTSSFIGPNGVIATENLYRHEWVSYILPKRYIDKYSKNGRIKLAITVTKNSSKNIYISGIASVRNPHMVSALTALGLHWASCGGSPITWHDSNWNYEILARFNTRTLYKDVRIPVVDINKLVEEKRDLFVGFIMHNNNSGDATLTIVNNSTNKMYKTGVNGFSRYKLSIMHNLYRYVRGIVIPYKELGIVKEFLGMHYLSLSIKSLGPYSGYIRGVYTEAI